jgi:hypothetical protein
MSISLDDTYFYTHQMFENLLVLEIQALLPSEYEELI